MSIRFNADEVFGMAERIEADGAAFYRKAAKLHAKSKRGIAGFLLKLAAMEDQHRATFAAMRAQASRQGPEETVFDPYLEAELYLNAKADSHGGEGSPKAAAALTGKETLAEVFRIAIGLEEKSIVFYAGLRDMAAGPQDQDRVDTIIEEEKSHLVMLTAELRKLKI